MKTKLFFLTIPVILIGLALSFQQKENDSTGYLHNSGELFEHLQFEKKVQEKMKGGNEKKAEMTVEILEKYLARVNHPYEKYLPMDVQLQLNEEINRMPKEPVTDNSALDQWRMMGPWGGTSRTNSSIKFSGRMRDVEPIGSSPATTVRFAAASGGVWRYVIAGIIVVPTSFGDNLPTQYMGSFCTNPTNENIVYAGTGEAASGNGLGLFKTTNLGDTWTPVTMTPTPTGFYKIRYQPGNQNIMHAATTTGFYRSTDGGTSWSRRIASGNVTDFTVNPSNTNEVWCGIGAGDNGICGLYKSINNGQDWNRVTTSPLPASNIRDIKIAQSPSNPQIIYFSASRWDNNQTHGFYKTTNGGTNWTSIVPAAPNFDIHGGQGGYNDAICISPVNSNIVFIGGVELIRTTDGGTTWQNANQLAVYWHADQHMLRYNSAGTMLYSCSDGGIFTTSDNGNSWSSAANTVPITQFYSVATPMNEKAAVIGGTQDNGTMITTNGTTWYLGTGGDGAGSAIDPSNTNVCFSFTWFQYGYSMCRFTSNNAMSTYTTFNSGIPANSYWWGIIRQDRVSPVYLYTNSGPYVYYTTSPGGTWIQMNTTAFPYEVWTMDVSKFSGSTVVYAGLNNPSPNSASKLRVFDNPNWFERSSSLPAGTNVERISQHPVNNNIAYACMQGYSSAGQKIYKTTNRGVNWVNITGNLPNISVTGLIPHPTNASIMVAGSYGGGIYKTTNGGTNWFQWMNGMPDVIYVDNMTWIDSTGINGKFYVVSNSHGRSIWTRNITGDDPTGIVNQNNIPNRFSLNQNYPNPFNPATTISYDLPRHTRVKISVYDITGKIVTELVNENKPAGSHRIQWDGSKFSSGVYFYRIEAGDFKDTKKMMLVK